MGNKTCRKEDFDWSSYKKQLRRLSKAQESELSQGRLYPILEYVARDPEVRLDIRPNKANIYFDGGSLLCLEGARESAFRSVFDLGYVGQSGRITELLPDAGAVRGLVDSFAGRRQQMKLHGESGHDRSERRIEQYIARANDARSLETDGGLVIFDIEYCYARRRFDFVLFDPAGLPEPRLMLGELKCRYGALHGTAGLRVHAIDFGDFVCAGGGRHVEIVKTELAGVVKQKQRLSLLSPEMAFERFSGEPPEFLVVFADYDVRRRQLDEALNRFCTEIGQRLNDLSLVKFADFPTVDDGSTDKLRLCRDRVMDASEFAAYRQRVI